MVKPECGSMPWTPMNTRSRWTVRSAATANGPTSASDGVRTPPVRMIVWSAARRPVEDLGDGHRDGHDRQVRHVHQAAREGVGGRPGGDSDRRSRVARAPWRPPRSPPSRAPAGPTWPGNRARRAHCRAPRSRHRAPSATGSGCPAPAGRGGWSCPRRRAARPGRPPAPRRPRGRARGCRPAAGSRAGRQRSGPQTLPLLPAERISSAHTDPSFLRCAAPMLNHNTSEIT